LERVAAADAGRGGRIIRGDGVGRRVRLRAVAFAMRGSGRRFVFAGALGQEEVGLEDVGRVELSFDDHVAAGFEEVGNHTFVVHFYIGIGAAELEPGAEFPLAEFDTVAGDEAGEAHALGLVFGIAEEGVHGNVVLHPSILHPGHGEIGDRADQHDGSDCDLDGHVRHKDLSAGNPIPAGVCMNNAGAMNSEIASMRGDSHKKREKHCLW
jgi:hypothetical protein